MKNADIAKVFQDIADLLELKGENVFKIRAYQRASQAIEHLPREIEQLLKEGGNLRDIPGVGEAIAKKTTELVNTGRLGYYEELKAEFPPGISTLLDIRGIGPKTALRLVTELGISSVEDLETAILSGRVAELPRMGDKLAQNILQHIQALRKKEQRIPLGLAVLTVDEILPVLSRVSGVRNLTPAGSLRRFWETVGDIDIMGTADDTEKVLQMFVGLPQVNQVLAVGSTKASVIVTRGFQVDLRLVEHAQFGSLLQHFTGSKQHNIILREQAHLRGLKLSEYGITVLVTDVTEAFATEEAFYQRLGLQFIPPEIREGGQEIDLAEQGKLPRLVEKSDIKGDLHVHTEWSDGHGSIEEMALAARQKGYRYLAITDHSAGRGIAHGLTAERLREQLEEIKRLNQSLEGIHILSGSEVDIRADGSLDFDDELLSQLDVVVASVHSAMGQDEAKMTQRVIRAMNNPHVDILGHPTCRLLGERSPVAIDMEAVFQAALQSNTALEINAMPSRLDLKDVHIQRAKELWVKLVMGTDSHSSEQLDHMRFGVGMARRGWCEPQHILNTGTLAELQRSFNSAAG
jgi:DNA polymerase (family 10)